MLVCIQNLQKCRENLRKLNSLVMFATKMFTCCAYNKMLNRVQITNEVFFFKLHSPGASKFALNFLISDRSPDVDLSDDDEGAEDVEDWSNDEMSDSDQPMHDDDTRMRTRTRKSGRGPNRPTAMNRVQFKFINFQNLLCKKKAGFFFQLPNN